MQCFFSRLYDLANLDTFKESVPVAKKLSHSCSSLDFELGLDVKFELLKDDPLWDSSTSLAPQFEQKAEPTSNFEPHCVQKLMIIRPSGGLLNLALFLHLQNFG